MSHENACLCGLSATIYLTCHLTKALLQKKVVIANNINFRSLFSQSSHVFREMPKYETQGKVNKQKLKWAPNLSRILYVARLNRTKWSIKSIKFQNSRSCVMKLNEDFIEGEYGAKILNYVCSKCKYAIWFCE